jgi:hypothetical protein
VVEDTRVALGTTVAPIRLVALADIERRLMDEERS